MPRLILMRHCKSDWSMGEADHARRLNPRGRRAAGHLGDWLRTAELRPDLVLCSDAARTRETLSLLDISAETRFEKRLYLAEPQTMLEVLRDGHGATILMIGHNPGIGEMAERLLEAAVDHPRFVDYPTGATLVVDMPGSDWRDATWAKGVAKDFVVPRELE